MTGFGASEKEGFKVEIRSLNHKHLDISVKMPSALMEHDMAIRNMVKEYFVRGKFDLSISITDRQKTQVGVNLELAEKIQSAFSELQKKLSLPGSIGIDFFSGYRELIITEEPEYNSEALYQTVSDALSKLQAMRNTEGENLKSELSSRISGLQGLSDEIETEAKDTSLRRKESLQKKINDLIPNISVDENRLAQEIALLAQKSDITEEIARLRSHIQQFASILSEGGNAGRKFDFILQEMHREVNTIASKSDDIKIINLTIEMKTEIEKLREQAQNIQ
jgi:uncharacterized protein (TIGR00255 family)